MGNFKSSYSKKILSLVLAAIMTITLVPVGVFAQGAGTETPADALSSATYYRKANWENKIKDKSRWPVGDNQRLVRVTTSEPVEMNDIDYDGNFIDANGRTVLRMVYKEKGAAATAVWYRAIFNFGDLDQYIDYDKSYMVGVDVLGNEAKKGNLEPFNDRKERIVDLSVLRGDLTNQRKNLPINLVLKEGVTIDTLGKQNYIVQMRLADTNGERIYAYAPKGTSMDYSTYTKTTSVSLEDKVNRLFIKGGYQSDGNNATNQEFVMSEFIANPEQYKDEKNLGIIRTQYMGQRDGSAASPTVGGKPIAFTQVFDANLLNYLKADDKGNVAYVNVLEDTRLKSQYTHNFGIKLTDFNKTADGKLAYVVIAPHDFQKDGIKKVEIPQHDQYTMLSGIYITAIDYVVDKGKFEDTFAGRTAGIDATRKLNYSMISGWTNPNVDGWAIFEKTYDDGYVAHEGESFIIDTTTDPTDEQIMIQIGNEDAIIRRQQGYYTYYVTSDKGIETIEKYADGIFKFKLREGATVKAGDKVKVFMPYTKDHTDPVNFLEIHNGTELNEGGATLKLQKDRNINMHLYKEGKKGYYILKYTLADGTEAEKKFEPKLLWQFDNKDKVMDPGTNATTGSIGGNFYINTSKLQPGADIFVESYDENGTKLEDQTSWFKYRPLTKAQDTVKELTWTDHSDKSSILSINKSLYTPYQVLFTNDYAEGTDDFYKDPRVLPADNAKFNTDTTEFVGYTKYDGGKVRTLYDGKDNRLYAKVEAVEDEYNDKGELTADNSKMITIPKSDIFDAQFAGDSKEYKAYEYKVDLTKMLPYHSDDTTETKLELKKDMKFLSTASDGSSLPSDLYETRVRARVLFDANTGKLTEDGKQVDKVVKIAPDNINFLDQEDYKANGFEGANVKKDTGDKFPEAPKLEGKNFLGWVTEAGKTALGKNVVTADEFNALPKEQIFTNETPITKHLVVYAIYSDEVTVTFDANQGTFTDGKDTTNIKVEGGNVTKPADPTRGGYTFKGWAATKDATEADANILNNVTAAKTVYAVWEQTKKEPLKLNDPEKTVVKDKTSLTEPEQEKVEAAVIKANPDLNLTKEDVVVDDDGTVTVTKNGQTGTITPDKTVTQKEDVTEFNPPKEPVPVENKTALTDDEKAKVRQAVKAANPDRNLEDNEITVGDDGKVTINQDGKTGEIPADKTVVQKDTMLDLTPPEKTEVKDITNLTQAERDKVAAAVKKANEGKLSADAVVTVDNKGNVTVTDGTKTGKLEGKDTVKPFDRAGKTLKDPAITTVADTSKLTDAEKQAVKDAVKAANKDLGFTDDEIQVADDGTVTVPMGTDGKKTIEPAKTVKKSEDADKTINLVPPEKTPVQNLDGLTADEKEKVKEAVKKANPTLPDTAKIEVANDGSVVVTDGDKTGTLSQKDTVVDDTNKFTLNKPRPVKVVDPQNVTTDEQAKIKKAVKDVNPGLTDDQITVDDKGNVTVTVKEGETTKTAKLGPEDTIEKDDTTPGAELKDPAKVAVKDPANLTPEEKQAIKDAVKKANPGLTDDQIAVDKEGNVTVTKPGEEPKTIGKDKTVSKDVKTPTPTEVADKTNLTDDEKRAVKQAVEDANKDGSGNSTLPEGVTITVGNDGTVTVKDKDGKETIIPASDTVTQTATPGAELKDPAKVAVKDPANLTDAEKQAIKDAVKKANPGLTDDQIAVDKEGNVTVTKPGEEPKTIGKDKTVSKDVKTPELTEVANPASLTDDEKAAVKKAVEDANKDGSGNSTLPEGVTITVGNDGTVTVKDKDGKETIIPASDTVTQTATPGAELKDPAKVAVKDPANLTPEEKQAIKDAVKKANPGLTDDQIAVDKEGNVTVTKPGEEPKTIGKDKTVSTDVKTPELTEVADKTNLTDDEKAAVKKAVEDANKDGSGNSTLPEGATITVGNDGTVTVKDKDGKETIIPASDTVKEKATSGANVNAPETPVTVDNSKALTPEEKEKVKKAVEDANKDGSGNSTLPEGTTIDVADDGTVTVKDKTGKEIAKITPDKTVKQDNTKLPVKPADPIPVENPDHLTDAEKEAVKDAIKKANPDLADATIDVDDKGNVTVKKDGKEGKLTPAQTIKKAGEPTPSKINPPYNKVKVNDKDHLSYLEKRDVEDAVRHANPNLPEGATIEVADDGTVTIKDKDGNIIGRIPGWDTVEEDSFGHGGYFYEPSPEYLNRYTPSKKEEPKKEEPKKEEKAEPRYLEAFRWYVRGNEHGEFMPKKGITRAEVAQIFARALGYDKTLVNANSVHFSDVNANEWYYDAVVKTVAAGIFKGTDLGTFMPNREITRAELIATIARFQKLDLKAGNTMNMPEDHWALAYVEAAYQEGWLDIYERGLAKFEADGVITREEVVTILNRAFGREADINYIDNNLSRLYKFNDIDKSLWSYYEILTAANTYVVGEGWIDHSSFDGDYDIEDVKWDRELPEGSEVEQVKFQR